MTGKNDIIAELRRLVERQATQLDAQAKQLDALTNRISELEL
jgi:uncharacterized coiled-coil protein SlyX